MKNSVFLLLIILLSSTFLSAVNLTSAVIQTGSDATSNNEPNAAYTYTGSLGVNELDYWRVNASAGETLTIGIEANAGAVGGWISTLYYSNGDVAQSLNGYNAHSHIFLVTKNDNYILVLSSLNNHFNYTIDSSHPMVFANAYKVTGFMSTNELNYWKFVAYEGDTLLVGVWGNAGAVGGWISTLYYSNGTVAQSINNYNAHNHVFVVPKTGCYLLVLSSLNNVFNYTIVSSHQMVLATPYKVTGFMSTNELNYWKFVAYEGDTLLVGVWGNAGAVGGWISTLYYSNGTVAQSINNYNAHNHVFVVPKTGCYLLVLSSLNNVFNYTIVSSHQMVLATPYKVTGFMSTNEIDYMWFNNLKVGDVLLVGVWGNAGAVGGWISTLYYSNGTVAQSINNYNAHNIIFPVPKDDNYLLELKSLSNSFDYTIVHNIGPEQLQLSSVTPWYWFSNTSVTSTAIGNLNNDDQTEIVTGGYFNDGTRNIAQLVVWNGSNLVAEKIQYWYWTGNTEINSVVVGDVDGDCRVEVVTGGFYNDGVRNVAQLCVWDGATLALENVKTWYWTSNTMINSIALGDVDYDGHVEIVTGGFYNDGARNVAQLCVWSGSSLVLENVKVWYWTGNTVVNSVAIEDVDGDGQVEIVSGGSFFDGSRNNAQLVEWNGTDLAVDRVTSWYWTSNTIINSIALGDVDHDSQIEIVTGGYYNDGVRNIAQLIEWNGANLAVDRLTGWYWTSNTAINSVSISYLDTDLQTEIVTGGQFNDGTRDNAQLVTWSGSSLAAEHIKSWYLISNTKINSIGIGQFNNNFSDEIVTGGTFYDGIRLNSQLTVWGMT